MTAVAAPAVGLVVDRLDSLAPIGLSALNARAGLQTRTDRKYVLTVEELDDVLDELDPGTRVLEIDGARSFAYESVYFDSPDLACYRSAAQRRRRRFKIRTRTYLDAHTCWLEVKTRGARGSTVKRRLAYPVQDRTCLTPGRHFLEKALDDAAITGVDLDAFTPILVTGYRRCTLYVPDTASRVTIDTELAWRTDDGGLRIAGTAIVESKTGSVASSIDHLLWADGHRPTSVSKYATGLAALHPELPSNRWHRTLRRHFLPTLPAGAPSRPSLPAL